MATRKEPLTIYLTSWQRRMVKDFMPSSWLKGKSIKDITKIELKPIIGECPKSYLIPQEGIRKGDWVLYFTDEQMTMLREYLRSPISISSVNISPEFLKTGDVSFR